VPVIAVFPNVSPFGKILPGDIILAIDGQAVGLDGRIVFQGERIDFEILYDLRQIGDTVDFYVQRGDKKMHVPVKITRSSPAYSRSNIYARYPKYFVFAGLVFTTLSRNLLQTWGKQWYTKAPTPLRFLHRFALYTEPFDRDEDIIVFLSRLPHPVNRYI